MRSTLGADRSRIHLEAHAKGDTVTHSHLRAEHVVDWATRGGAKALGLDHAVGSLEAGKKADVVLLKNDNSPTMFPILNPYDHVALQAGRADVHTVLVNGKVAKHDHKLVGADLAQAKKSIGETIDYLQTTMGADVWEQAMNPEIPETDVLDNPYTYTECKSDATHSH